MWICCGLCLPYVSRAQSNNGWCWSKLFLYQLYWLALHRWSNIFFKGLLIWLAIYGWCNIFLNLCYICRTCWPLMSCSLFLSSLFNQNEDSRITGVSWPLKKIVLAGDSIHWRYFAWIRGEVAPPLGTMWAYSSMEDYVQEIVSLQCNFNDLQYFSHQKFDCSREMTVIIHNLLFLLSFWGN